MPKFTVIIEQCVYEHTAHEVEAADRHEAEDKAFQGDGRIEWAKIVDSSSEVIDITEHAQHAAPSFIESGDEYVNHMSTRAYV